VWSPDGRRLLLGRDNELAAHTIDESAPDQVLVREPNRVLVPADWQRDGRIVYASSEDTTNFEIKVLDPGASAGRVIVPLSAVNDAVVSPEGRWLAYSTADRKVMVQAFPGPGARQQVSAAGGINPIWSADGRMLYFLMRLPHAPGTSVFAVDVAAGDRLTASKPREIVHVGMSSFCSFNRCWDMSADGKRFLFHDTGRTPREAITRIDLILNWPAAVK
jgi:Tol biopolymer transport system component